MLEKRKKEWLSTRALLTHTANSISLDFLPNGKPILTDNRFISISHSDDIAGIVISTSGTGMDIQSPDVKLLRIAGKFLNAHENAYLREDDERLSQLTLIWSAKEAVFKYFGEHVDFAADIRIDAFSRQPSTLTAHYNGKHGDRMFELDVSYHEQYIIVLATGDRSW